MVDVATDERGLSRRLGANHAQLDAQLILKEVVIHLLLGELAEVVLGRCCDLVVARDGDWAAEVAGESSDGHIGEWERLFPLLI